MNPSNVSIIIPVYNQFQITKNCLNDLLIQTNVNKEIIIIDDNSNKEPISLLISKTFPSVRLVKNDINLGFAKTVNRGILNSSFDNILLLNNDIRIFDPLAIYTLVHAMSGFDLVSPAGGRLSKTLEYIPGEAKKSSDTFSYLAGWCLGVKRKVFDKIGLIPEIYGFGFFEDVHFCYRAKKAGFKMGIIESPGIKHLYHTTFKKEGYNITKEYQEKRKIFLDAAKKEKLI